ncbi:hypothetical protein ATN79_03490 [Paraburkholderia caribensis]|nr:hypothetical protein ATN79_03490 [Paraburkholderia caribensis]
MIWILIAVGTAMAVVSDMRRLLVHRVGLSTVGWLFVCVGAGPFAIAAYLLCRRVVWQMLVDSVWQFIGDGSHPKHVRRRRLIALRRNGLIGVPVFHACLKMLNAR